MKMVLLLIVYFYVSNLQTIIHLKSFLHRINALTMIIVGARFHSLKKYDYHLKSSECNGDGRPSFNVISEE